MAEDDDRFGLIPVGECLLHPVELLAADTGPRAGNRAVEGSHVAHALLWRHLLRCPVVRSPADRIEPDEAHALVIEGPVGLAEQLAPLLAHIQIPVMLTRDVVLLDRQILEE